MRVRPISSMCIVSAGVPTEVEKIDADVDDEPLDPLCRLPEPGSASEGAASALGHGPTVTCRPIEGHIDRAVVERVTPSGPGVIRRKDAADEGDDGQAILAIRAQGVDIPPSIAPRRHGNIEARSAIRHLAANRPESAAMGTPAPG